MHPLLKKILDPPLSWQSLEECRAIGRLVLMLLFTFLLISPCPSHLVLSGCQSSHTSDLSYLWLQSNTNCYRSSFFQHTIPQWNSLPLTLHCASSTQSFKTGLSNLNISRIINTSHYYNEDHWSYFWILHIPHGGLIRLSL